MKKEVNILSIDWDYFINATDVDRAMLFPDGGVEDIPEYVQNAIWVGRYCNPALEKIGVLNESIRKLNGIIRKSVHKDTLFMVANSHKHIYDMVVNQYPNRNHILNLVNIDFHHDIYGEGSNTVHCGNWLKHFMLKYNRESKYLWVARKDSGSAENSNLGIKYEDFSGLDKVKWDIVYICKSGMWSPPHLDNEFKKAFSWITKDKMTKIQVGIFDSRYNREFRKAVNQYKEMLGKHE